MLHPAIDLKLVNPDIGYGVFATQDIPKGTITWALDPLDQIIEAAKAQNMKDLVDEQLRRYSWVNGSGDRILCWDFGRFMNHSCEPNSVGPGQLEFEIAVRDIAKGEEVTCDYGMFNLEEPLTCACGSAHCRGQVCPEDFAGLAPVLDKRVRAAFRDIQKVNQPLWSLVQKWRLQIERGIAQPSHLPSLAENKWPRVAESQTVGSRSVGARDVGARDVGARNVGARNVSSSNGAAEPRLAAPARQRRVSP